MTQLEEDIKTLQGESLVEEKCLVSVYKRDTDSTNIALFNRDKIEFLVGSHKILVYLGKDRDLDHLEICGSTTISIEPRAANMIWVR